MTADNTAHLAAMYFNYLLNMFHNNVGIAINAYQLGEGKMQKDIVAYSQSVGKSYNEVLKDNADLGWVKYITTDGSSNAYIQNVMSHFPKSAGNPYMIGRDGSRYEMNSSAVGTGVYDPQVGGASTGSSVEIVPDFEKYNFMKKYFEMTNEIICLHTEKMKGEEYLNCEESRRTIKEIFPQSTKLQLAVNDKKLDEVQDIVYKNGKTYYSIEDAYIAQIELQIKALVQFDLDGTDAVDNEIEYEIAHALLRLKRQAENYLNGYLDENDESIKYKMQNEPALDKKELEKQVKTAGDIVSQMGHDSGSDIEKIQYALSDKSTIRNNFLKKSMEKNALIVAYMYVTNDYSIPQINSNTYDKMNKVFNDYKKDKKINDKLLSALAIGRYMQRNAAKTFVENYTLFIADKDGAESDFTKYIQNEVSDTNKETSTGERIWDKIKYSLKIGAKYGLAGNTMSSAYIDNTMKDNAIIKFAIYTETREMIEIGAFTRTTCILQSSFNSQLCAAMNMSAYGGGDLSWENTDILTKTKQSSSLSYSCVKTEEQNDKGEWVPISYDDSPVIDMPNFEDGSTDKGFLDDVKDIFQKTYTFTADVLNSLGENAQAVLNQKKYIISPPSAYHNGETTAKVKKVISEDDYRTLDETAYKETNMNYASKVNSIITTIGKEVPKGTQFAIYNQYGKLYGEATISNDGSISLSYVSVLQNRSVDYSYTPPDCGAHETSKANYNSTVEPVYPDKNTLGKISKEVNLYHAVKEEEDKADKTDKNDTSDDVSKTNESTTDDYQKDLVFAYRTMTNVDDVEDVEFLDKFDIMMTGATIDGKGDISKWSKWFRRFSSRGSTGQCRSYCRRWNIKWNRRSITV